jgi:hypothetical protein
VQQERHNIIDRLGELGWEQHGKAHIMVKQTGKFERYTK